MTRRMQTDTERNTYNSKKIRTHVDFLPPMWFWLQPKSWGSRGSWLRNTATVYDSPGYIHSFSSPSPNPVHILFWLMWIEYTKWSLSATTTITIMTEGLKNRYTPQTITKKYLFFLLYFILSILCYPQRSYGSRKDGGHSKRTKQGFQAWEPSPIIARFTTLPPNNYNNYRYSMVHNVFYSNFFPISVLILCFYEYRYRTDYPGFNNYRYVGNTVL